jgi:pilus assembly protein Flp/PilA
MLKKVVGSVKRFVKEEEAQGMTEYGLIIALVVIVVIVGVTLLGQNLKAVFNDIAGKVVSGS